MHTSGCHQTFQNNNNNNNINELKREKSHNTNCLHDLLIQIEDYEHFTNFAYRTQNIRISKLI